MQEHENSRTRRRGLVAAVLPISGSDTSVEL